MSRSGLLALVGVMAMLGTTAGLGPSQWSAAARRRKAPLVPTDEQATIAAAKERRARKRAKRLADGALVRDPMGGLGAAVATRDAEDLDGGS